VNASTASVPAVTAPFEWRVSGTISWLDVALEHGHAAFSTRRGGVSEGPYDSLNLGLLTEDDPARVARNRVLLANALGRDAAAVAMGWQVHGAEIEIHETPPRPGRRGYATPGSELAFVDAQVTTSPQVTPLVLTADCVPLALAAPGVAAMVHCGWRGVAAGIVERAVACVRALSVSRRVAGAIGPAIGPCCYQVGDEVRAAFQGRGHEEDVLPGDRLDLALAVCRELERTGVPRDHLASCRLCTSCHPELFFSHRREGGVTGRQAGLAWLGS
jgi:YfiH family protein